MKSTIDYKDYLQLMRKIVWSFHITTGEDWNDLFQEAFLGFLEAREKYNPKKGKFSSFLWIVISDRLKKYLREEKESSGKFLNKLDDDLQSLIIHPISTDILEMIKVIGDNVGGLISLPRKETKRKVYEIMLKHGWSFKKTEQVLQELWIS